MEKDHGFSDQDHLRQYENAKDELESYIKDRDILSGSEQYSDQELDSDQGSTGVSESETLSESGSGSEEDQDQDSVDGSGSDSGSEDQLTEIERINRSEPILQDTLKRYTLFPIKHPDLWEAYKNHVSADWRAEELDYKSDLEQWNKLKPEEKRVVEHVLAFFAGSDGIVNENIMTNFSKEVQLPEARAFYAFQAHIEQIHSEVYSILIDTYIMDEKRKEELFNAIERIPCIAKKARWAMKWRNPEKATFAERIVAYSVVEGVFFSGSFCIIFWLKSRGIMVSGLGKSNELIARDENLHCKFAIQLHNKLENRLSKETIHKIFDEAMKIETEFIIESIKCKLIGMNSDLMSQYLKYVADFWMCKLITNEGKKCPKLYNAKNPFSFMNFNSLDGKTNFFEQRVTEYKASRTIQHSNTPTVIDDNF